MTRDCTHRDGDNARVLTRAVIAALLVIATTACAASPPSDAASSTGGSASPTASASARESTTPTASVSGTASVEASEPPASATEAAAPRVQDTIWQVLVTDLIVRSEPTIADTSAIFVPRLTDTDRVLVVDSPRSADGYEWFQVLPLRPDGLRERPFGWVARAHRDGTPWLALEELACPDPSADPAAFLKLTPEERLACYGDETIEFRGTILGCGAGGFVVTYEPQWLKSETGCGLGPSPDVTTLMLRFPPTVPETVFPGGTFDITGHLDDPAAATCVATSSDPATVAAPSSFEAVAICRTQFVVESVTP